jgi:hypothetical protein
MGFFFGVLFGALAACVVAGLLTAKRLPPPPEV